jgi:hypothetical protein
VRPLFTPAQAEGLRPEIVPQKNAHTVGARLSVCLPAETGSAVWALSLVGTLER